MKRKKNDVTYTYKYTASGNNDSKLALGLLVVSVFRVALKLLRICSNVVSVVLQVILGAVVTLPVSPTLSPSLQIS